MDSADLAEELVALVLMGKKTATCWSAADGGEAKRIGSRSVVLDSREVPRAVLETVDIIKLRFDQVDAEFASDEGEGDQTLLHWRVAHQRFFEQNGGFSPDMMLWCERFRVIAIL